MPSLILLPDQFYELQHKKTLSVSKLSSVSSFAINRTPLRTMPLKRMKIPRSVPSLPLTFNSTCNSTMSASQLIISRRRPMTIEAAANQCNSLDELTRKELQKISDNLRAVEEIKRRRRTIYASSAGLSTRTCSSEARRYPSVAFLLRQSKNEQCNGGYSSSNSASSSHLDHCDKTTSSSHKPPSATTAARQLKSRTVAAVGRQRVPLLDPVGPSRKPQPRTWTSSREGEYLLSRSS